jgi:hypothetical protein
MVTSMDDSGPPQALSLPRLQAMLREFGPSYFNRTGRHPLLYFQLLLLSQQFESVSDILVLPISIPFHLTSSFVYFFLQFFFQK